MKWLPLVLMLLASAGIAYAQSIGGEQGINNTIGGGGGGGGGGGANNAFVLFFP